MCEPNDNPHLIDIAEADISAELSRRGLHFLADAGEVQSKRPLSTQELIVGLARQEDARLHMALIALFLYQPHTETAVVDALSSLNPFQQIQLKLFYTAATLLQPLYDADLRQYIADWHLLPRYFNDSLSIPTTLSERKQLQQLGQQHRQLIGITANWSGSYRYAAERLSRRLAKESAWAV